MPAPSEIATGQPAAKPPGERSDSANAGVRREPELPDHEEVLPQTARAPAQEFSSLDEDPGTEEDDAARARLQRRQARKLARQVALDPDDGIALWASTPPPARPASRARSSTATRRARS